MPIYPYKDTGPRFGERVFLAPSAFVSGDVDRYVALKDEYRETLGRGC